MPDSFSRLARLLGGKPQRPPETKRSRTGPLIALHSGREPVWTPRNYKALAREGFAANAVGYRSVRMIAEAAASIDWLLYEGEREVARHPLLALLAKPNPSQDGRSLMETFYGHLFIAGNAYLEAASVDGTVRELHALRPDRMRVVAGEDGWPEAFEYAIAGRSVRFLQEGATPVPPILHLRLFNPTDDHYGLSPLEAAARAIDIHNAAGAWNKALLDNSARPSGALVYSGGDGGVLTEEQFARLKEELAATYQGAANAGRPLVLEGGLDWKPLSHSPRDMQHIDLKHMAAREIALAFGVPPMLLGIPGDNTFANYAEANRTFWRQTVLPLVARTAEAIGTWLGPAWGEALRLGFDVDKVEALSEERRALWERVEAARFLTLNEKRIAVGYGPLPGGDRLADAGEVTE
jgi:HK97 family phage portal protein